MQALWASCQIRKNAGCACAGNAGNVFPRRRFKRKPLVSDPGMHHGTCVTHVPWCMSGSLTCGDGENVPGIPGACAPAILRIWQEAHACTYLAPQKFLFHTNVSYNICYHTRCNYIFYHSLTYTFLLHWCFYSSCCLIWWMQTIVQLSKWQYFEETGLVCQLLLWYMM